MTLPLHSRFLGGVNYSSSSASPSPPEKSSSQPIDSVDSDFVVILAALLCALICVLGLVAVARCAWIRRISSRVAGNSDPPPPPPAGANKGLKKKVLKALPKLTYSADLERGNLSDCAICLAEFASGDEIRVLPQCGHGFHVRCIDTWLGSHSSCPSCRQNLVAAARPRHECGELPPASSSSAAAQPATRPPPTVDYLNRFLP